MSRHYKDTYRVTWEVDVFDGEGPVDAARKAQALQQLDREGYEVGVFYVIDVMGNKFKVDLDTDNPQAIYTRR